MIYQVMISYFSDTRMQTLEDYFSLAGGDCL